MFPDLFSIGPLTVHTYGLFVALGFALGISITIKMGKRRGISPQQVMDMAFVMILFAILGSRLLYVFMNFHHFRGHPLDAFKVWQGGLVFSGGFLAVAAAMAWYLRNQHLSFWAAGDLWAPALALGQAVGRIGCFMAGCCFGKPTDLPWATVFTHPHTLAPPNIPLHPTQLYASFAGFAIFAVLIFVNRARKFQGQVFLWYLILHSTARLFIERFRADNRGFIPGTEMSLTQLISALVLLAAIVGLFVLKPLQRQMDE
ncbi:MAG: prolipoprotein diacylglyceryl transferase [Deltaproteobacteria bacterium]|nr:prolipoprotein diacylglyceryl transferase [Deltaproteobacteria bacterium]